MTDNVLRLTARILLSILFAVTGYWKVADPTSSSRLLGSMHLPAPELLAYAIGIGEILAAAALVAGFRIRPLGFMLAIWCIATGLIVHIAMPLDVMKNFGLAGGFLLLAVDGGGQIAIDRKSRPVSS